MSPLSFTRKNIKPTEYQKQCLRDQVFTPDEPGAVLHDFRAILDFVGLQGGVEVAGKYNLLPLKFIGELDRRLSRPLHLELKRPQLKSHPYLQGLYLLLRASGLSRVQGAGTRARLIVDPDMLAQWDALNFTEQYFNLLEAWLWLGRPEQVGEERHVGEEMLFACLQAWDSVPAISKSFDTSRPAEAYFPQWHKNLQFPPLEPREGTVIFRVSLGDIWRRIAIPASDDLKDLVTWILRSFEFDADHLYRFTYRDRIGRKVMASSPYIDDGPSADQVKIGRLPLEPGHTMDFLYDFGDMWEFTIKLESIKPPGAKIKAPRIMERYGKAPAQYPYWDE